MPDLDPTARLLQGIDRPRPLPRDARDRIVEHIAGAEPAPRPLPAGADARITAAVLAAADALGDRIDRPRPLPVGLYSRLEASLLTTTAVPAHRRRYAGARAFLVAASVVGVLGLAAAVLVDPGGPDRLATSPGTAGIGPSGEAGAPAAPPVPHGPTGPLPGGTAMAGASRGSDASSPPAGRTSGAEAVPVPAPAPRPSSPPAQPAAAGGTTGHQGAPPPYSEGGQPDRTGAAPAPAAGCCSSASPSPSSDSARSEPVVIGITAGDARIEAGFRAYVDATNSAGGVGGRPIRLVTAVGGQPASSSTVTVNLGAQHLTGWSGGPLLETLTVPEAHLTQDTFSVASVVEHQARLAVDEVFPETSSGRTAVIYTSAAAPWTDRVPDAYESVLRSRAVAVTRVMYDAGSPAFAPADAAFLSLDSAATARWLRDARAAGYSPTLGVTGVFPLHDAGLAATAPPTARVLSPYRFPVGDEATRLQSAVGGLDARAVHGWATAKHLAVALWRSGARTSRQTADALRSMGGYDGRLAPPYETRPGTTSRRPDALLHRLDGDEFVASGDFRTDPR